jgi:hypothetical protein
MRDGHIVAVEELFGLTEEEAVITAHKLYLERGSSYEGFEVWDRTRFLLKHPSPDVDGSLGDDKSGWSHLRNGRSSIMPIDPTAENTIEDENDADFELDDLFKEPNNRAMAAVIAHSQQLIFVDGRIKEYFFSKAKELLKRNQWDE